LNGGRKERTGFDFRHFDFFLLPGGGSLINVQNTPSSLSD